VIEERYYSKTIRLLGVNLAKLRSLMEKFIELYGGARNNLA
jgi:hypothetical protein